MLRAGYKRVDKGVGGNSMIHLETERLILRDYCESDFDEYYRLKSDSKTMYYLQDIQLFTEEEAREDFQMVLEDMVKPDRKFYFLHMELKEVQNFFLYVLPICHVLHLQYFGIVYLMLLSLHELLMIILYLLK